MRRPPWMARRLLWDGVWRRSYADAQQGSMGLQLLGAMLGFLMLTVVLWDFFLVYIGHRRAQTAADAAAVAVGYGIGPYLDELALVRAQAVMRERVEEVRAAGRKAREDYLDRWRLFHPPPPPDAPAEERQAWEEAYRRARETAARRAERARERKAEQLFSHPALICTREEAAAGRDWPPPGERYWLLDEADRHLLLQRTLRRYRADLQDLANQWAAANDGRVQRRVRLLEEEGFDRLEVEARWPLRLPLVPQADDLSVPAQAAVTPAPQPDHSWCR